MERDDAVTLAVDLGKTRCRVAVMSARGVLEGVEDEGTAGAAVPDGAGEVSRRVLDLVRRLPAHGASAVGVGAAGALTDAVAAREIATALVSGLRLPVAVTSDVVTAHVGALGGGAGVGLVAGTGAVALGVTAGGELRRVDGWGPHLGDLGGGSWIGREGMRAVLRAESGLGPATGLAADLAGLIGSEGDVVRWVSVDPIPARRLAAFAPAVLGRAAAGDGVAVEIADQAAALLAESAHAASGPTSRRVSVLGGLTGAPWFVERLVDALRSRGLVPVAPAGSALDGAHIIARRADLPHERYIHRAQ
ncbi:N-acetylglucosamine kinase [Georgenia thermotolerans]|uniref:ATPase n=1 Tax=Georgenia thermotolerans TaxID=527326 RepID=A0A7J5URV5_9MICO|nr:BadF/BadG/BcrA/BcrD ATPase family protein [Georgenia thermotolerans]KAE8765079.1 ATPase [Georgenia thermotolerans]